MKIPKELPKDLCPTCNCENFRINHEDISYIVCQTEGCVNPYHYEEKIVELKLIKTDDATKEIKEVSSMHKFLKRDL